MNNLETTDIIEVYADPSWNKECECDRVTVGNHYNKVFFIMSLSDNDD